MGSYNGGKFVPIYNSLDTVLSSIRQYAEEHELTPQQVSDYFSVGISAKAILADPEKREASLSALISKLISERIEKEKRPGGLLS